MNLDSTLVYAVVISFNDGESLYRNIVRLKNQTINIIVVDNGSNLDTKEILSTIEMQELASVIRLERNYGIGFALNRGVKTAIDLGAEWVITLDQDSTPADDMIGNMLKFAKENDNKELNISIMTPKVLYQKNNLNVNSAYKYITIETAITSGNMVHRDVFSKIGLYDESFFIDSVDFDFCLRARLAGYSIFSISSAVLSHSLGKLKQCSFMRIKFNIHTHGPIRRYYIMRNHLYLQERFFHDFPLLILKKNFFIIILLIQILILETDKAENIRMILRGINDYFARKQGELTV
jgi:rhamnosyltransferase